MRKVRKKMLRRKEGKEARRGAKAGHMGIETGPK